MEESEVKRRTLSTGKEMFEKKVSPSVPRPLFRPFTCDTLAAIEARIAQTEAHDAKQRRASTFPVPHETRPHPHPALKVNMRLPPILAENFPKELIGTPIEDIDRFYDTQRTFMVISKGKNIFRFSATKSFWLLSPFNPVRRIAIQVLVHPIFNFLVISTILVNCVIMTFSENEEVSESDNENNQSTDKTFETIFTAIYTLEFFLKVIARGFIFEKFTYLRDPWNWLDFTVIGIAYITLLNLNVGNLGAMRAFRVLRALKTVAVIPGLKTIVGAVIESIKNLRDVIFLTLFALSVFALLGSQLYMGVLSHKCIRNGPVDMSDEDYFSYINNSDNWYGDSFGRAGAWELCNNSTGRKCPKHFTCLTNIGPNPDFGYTSFDTFPLALLSSFRLITQDFWESLYQMILVTAGPWHILFFILIIFLGSFYLINLILAIVAMSYDALHQQAEEEEAIAEEEEAIAAEEEAIAAEEAAMASEKDADGSSVMEAYDSKRNSGYFSGDKSICNSPDSSVQEKEFLAGSNTRIKENTEVPIIIQPNGPKTKVSQSLPASPYLARRSNCRRSSTVSWKLRRHHKDYKSCVIGTIESIKEAFPYADDSKTTSPTLEAVSVTDDMDGTPRHMRRPSFLSYAENCRKNSLTADNQLSWHSRNLYRFCLEEPKAVRYPSERRLSTCNPYDGMYIDSHGQMIDMTDIMVNDEFLMRSARRQSRRSLRGSSAFEGKLSFKERSRICYTNFIDNYCIWDCCTCWIRIQNLISLIVFDPFVELFITLCIVLNTLFMAIDHAHIQPGLKTFLINGNYFFTGIFAFEAGLKLLALSPKFYFKEVWNSFDFFIVTLSMMDIFLGGERGWSVLRSFRLLRVFKLAKSWPTLNLLISIMLKTIGALANLTLVLGIIIFIFAVLGMQLFGKNYSKHKDRFPSGEVPRWNFKDFLHSFMIVFRVLCGEWVESMWDCLLVAGWACIPFFLATVVFGNLVMLNLFLALLLSSFGGSNFSQAPVDSKDAKKLQEAIDRFSTAYYWVRKFPRQIRKSMQSRQNQNNRYNEAEGTNHTTNEAPFNVKTQLSITAGDTNEESKKLDFYDVVIEKQLAEKQMSLQDTASITDDGSKENLERQDDLNAEEFQNESCIQTDKNSDQNEEQPKETDAVILKAPPECCPESCYTRFSCCRTENTASMERWLKIRTKSLFIAEHKHFETIIITMILISSLALTLEDVHLNERPLLQEILQWMDRIFTFLFLFEMLIKWVAFGFKEYFKSVWCWLDFVIVLVSLIILVASLCKMEHISVFKVLRTLRALRPLRALSRFQGMKVVVNAFVQAIPAIFNVLLVCLILWLIFAIMGVQLFGGKFGACMENGERVNASLVSNKTQCETQGLIWHIPKVNFDNVLHAYLALFQVATFKGWIDIMYCAIDSTKVDEQPENDKSIYMYFYFVLFIIFGAFFTLNLFIGVLIDNFNEQKKKIRGSLDMFMTEDQKKYYNALKKMGSKKPTKAIPRPKFRIQAYAFDIVTNKKFDMLIMIFICLNMVAMACDVHEPGGTRKMILDSLNIFFISVFTAECVLKVFALRFFYFKEPWNVFDFIIVIFSILSIAVKDVLENYMVSPTLLRVVRVVKIGRVLRLVKGAKGIRTLLFALVMSLPALFNICLLLFLVMFIYAIFGMFLFKDVPFQKVGINEDFNFQTFGKSMILLFQMSTSAGWHDVLAGLMGTEHCPMTAATNTTASNTTTINANIMSPKGENSTGIVGTCVEPNLAIAYLVTYLVICFLIIINMYIAVILENYSQATEDVQEGLTDDDYDMYYEIWQKFDPLGTQFIKFSVLEDFIDALEEPLQIPKPNKYRIIFMNIPICEGDMVYCVDILDCLTKDFFMRKGRVIEETAEMEEVVPKETESYKPISTTLRRQREMYCATIIQAAWKSFKTFLNMRILHPQIPASAKSDSDLVVSNGMNVRLSPSPVDIYRSTEV